MMILADWGTTNLRAWLVDASGQLVQRHESAMGIKAARQAGFASVFDGVVAALGADTQTTAIISGMASSKGGWQEVPYAPTPADASAIAKQACPVDGRSGVRLVGGVCSALGAPQPEVMRGEEVQALGILMQHPEATRLCLPGTHSKWIAAKDDAIVGLQTFMTGELFEWLTRDSLIATQITAKAFDASAFNQGLDLASEAMPLTRALFQLRTRFLGGQVNSDQVYVMASGLLIGHEAVSVAGDSDEPVYLCAAGTLADSYQAALSRFGIQCVTVDPEQATLDGLLSLYPLIHA